MLAACAGLPMLLALTVVGRVTLTPAEPLDARVAAAFNAHQRRARLGPGAAAAAVHHLRPSRPAFGHASAAARPPRLRSSSGRALGASMRPTPTSTAEWADGWISAAREQDPSLAGEASAYLDRRLAQAAAGELAVTVDHADVLALP